MVSPAPKIPPNCAEDHRDVVVSMAIMSPSFIQFWAMVPLAEIPPTEREFFDKLSAMLTFIVPKFALALMGEAPAEIPPMTTDRLSLL